MSWINDTQERRLRQYRQDPHLQPIIDRIEAAQHDGATGQEMVQVALTATRDQYVREQRPAEAGDLRRDAYRAASVGAVEKPYQLQDLPAGTDKTKHYFVSGELAAGMDRTLENWHLPTPVRQGLAIGVTATLGFLKEVADIFTSGFSREDLRADMAGARSPFRP